MTRIETILQRLPVAQRTQVENYAASLVPRDAPPDGRPNRIQLDELDGLLTRMSDEMDWPEIEKRLRNEWADSGED